MIHSPSNQPDRGIEGAIERERISNTLKPDSIPRAISGRESERHQQYEKHIRNLCDLYGTLEREHPLYQKLDEVLNKLIAVKPQFTGAKLDCILRDERECYVFPDENHIVMSYGQLKKMCDKQGNLIVDKIAGIFAHELTHVKYRDQKGDSTDKVRNYMIKREHERLGDLESLDWVNEAGYNPTALIDFFNDLQPEREKDYMVFLLEGIQALTIDPHDMQEQRVRYLQETVDQRSYRNEKKEFEVIKLEDFPIFETSYGFLKLIEEGQIQLAFQKTKEPWQGIYIYNYLKNSYAALKELKDQIEEQDTSGLSSEEINRKDRQYILEKIRQHTGKDISEIGSILGQQVHNFLKSECGLNSTESDILWNTLTSLRAVDYTGLRQLEETGAIDLNKIFTSLPRLFPPPDVAREYLFFTPKNEEEYRLNPLVRLLSIKTDPRFIRDNDLDMEKKLEAIKNLNNQAESEELVNSIFSPLPGFEERIMNIYNAWSEEQPEWFTEFLRAIKDINYPSLSLSLLNILLRQELKLNNYQKAIVVQNMMNLYKDKTLKAFEATSDPGWGAFEKIKEMVSTFLMSDYCIKRDKNEPGYAVFLKSLTDIDPEDIYNIITYPIQQIILTEDFPVKKRFAILNTLQKDTHIPDLPWDFFLREKLESASTNPKKSSEQNSEEEEEEDDNDNKTSADIWLYNANNLLDLEQGKVSFWPDLVNTMLRLEEIYIEIDETLQEKLADMYTFIQTNRNNPKMKSFLEEHKDFQNPPRAKRISAPEVKAMIYKIQILQDLRLKGAIDYKTIIAKLEEFEQKFSLVAKKIDRKPLEQLLDSDIDTTALLYSLNHDETELLHEIPHPRATELTDLVHLQQAWKEIEMILKQKSRLKFITQKVRELPSIPEKNLLLWNIFEKYTGNKAVLYRSLLPFFHQDDRSVQERVNAGLKDPQCLKQLYDALTRQSIPDTYALQVLGISNYAQDECAKMAWEATKTHAQFETLPIKKQLQLLQRHFPKISYHREKIICTDINPTNSTECRMLQKNVHFPFAQYHIGGKLFACVKAEQEHPDWKSMLTSIRECLPEASFYRDQVINQEIHRYCLSREQIKEAKMLLLQGNTLTHTADEQIYHLFLLSVIRQIFYLAPQQDKIKIFSRLMDQAANNEKEHEVITSFEKKELIGALLFGKFGITGHVEFRHKMESLFLRKMFQAQDVENKERYERYCGDAHIIEQYIRQIIDAGKLDLDQENFIKSMESIDKIIGRYEQETDRVEFETLSNISQHSTEKVYSRSVLNLRKCLAFLRKESSNLKQKIPETLLSYLPILNNVFFAIVETFPVPSQARIYTNFLTKTLEHAAGSREDLIVTFLECLGISYIKSGQDLASLGFFDTALQEKLLKLTSSVDATSIFEIDHFIDQEYAEKSVRFSHIGPLISTASVRQVEGCIFDQESRVLKAKLPFGVKKVDENLQSLRDFETRSRANSMLLGGTLQLPTGLIAEVTRMIETEVKGNEDQVIQNQFHAKYHGTSVAGKMLFIPEVDNENSTLNISLERHAPGQPLNPKTLSPLTAGGLLHFFLKLILEEGFYHANPHPGNVLEDSSHLSLVDFGMVGKLKPANRGLFFDMLVSIYEKDAEALRLALLTAHCLESDRKEKMQQLNPAVIKKTFEVFLEKIQREEHLNFEKIVLDLMYTIELLKIRLPSELKVLIKTISQMGYLISDNQEMMKNIVGQQMILHYSEYDTGKEDPAIAGSKQAVQKWLEASEDIGQSIVVFPSGTKVQMRGRTETYQLKDDSRFDTTLLDNLTMQSPFNQFPKLAVQQVNPDGSLVSTISNFMILPQPKSNYEIYYNGEWRNPAEILYPKKLKK